MDEIYSTIHHPTSDHEYADQALMSPENLMIPLMDYHDHYHYHSSMINNPTADHHRINNPVFGSPEKVGFQCSESASINVHQSNQRDDGEDEEGSSLIKAKIASHPSYPRLLDAYIACQKVGAPPEIANLLDEIRRQRNLCNHQHDVVSMCLDVDPELDQFMEMYCDILVKYKMDLCRPFEEATSFLNTMETQLQNLCNADDGGLSSDDEDLSGGEIENIPDTQTKSEDRELKDELLRRYGGHISTLKLEFSKKKKKGKLPKEARQTLLEWWNLHHKWPYPTEGDKISLAETTGLDQKQINNWFINQRKRHWKSSENMQLAMMDNFSAAHHFFTED